MSTPAGLPILWSNGGVPPLTPCESPSKEAFLARISPHCQIHLFG
jgi:hypothetical protein